MRKARDASNIPFLLNDKYVPVPVSHPILKNGNVCLRAFVESDITERYLSWLSDPRVNEFSQRRESSAVSREDALAYFHALRPHEVMLAILHDPFGHVGNLKYGPVDWLNSRCDISILIGETAVWGVGVGALTISAVTRYLFDVLDLNRVEAGSNNPAFLRCVEKLGWKTEGVLRQRVRTSQGFRDHTLVSLLRSDVR